ncbi:tyrosine-type recombinase/integrase [Allisonella histaminiformans]|uniref:tyrosine-type recombinase/integrase n=1 Tax=Allisonella histaminiformans TaxID=209880 RepID=UPI002E767AF4|nr:tyrosine-type recombinase/integrase [Allisonella histaminiformans]
MRKPNGYGCIKKLSGNRRRPYVFVVSARGKQRPVEYFATQTEAEIYAADYNKLHKHRSLPGHQMTFAELYYRWLNRHIVDTSPSVSAINGYRNSFSHCSSIQGMNYTEIRYSDYQRILDDMRKSGLSYSSVKKVRSLFSLMEKYANKIEINNKNYASLLSLGRNRPVRPHKPFSRQKINRLWSISDAYGVDTVLILLYTGMRVGEMLNLLKSDINQRQHLIRIARSKTAAGIRSIPIHHRILPFILNRLQTPGQFLFTDNKGNPYNYSRYCVLWREVMHKIRADNHTTHDCRHTVATLLDNAGANETAKRRILGHSGGDVTERVYTHKNLRQLRKCIELLP